MMLSFLVIAALFCGAQSARILGVVSTPSYSHQIPWQPLWQGLHARGHHLTILTTNPINNASLTNLTEINLSFLYQVLEENQFVETAINDSLSMHKKALFMYDLLINMTSLIYENTEVKELIENKANRFDLVMVESSIVALLALVWRFQCPWISISSLDGFMYDHYIAGNSLHPVLYPEINFEIKGESMNFWERLASTLVTTFLILGVPKGYFPNERKRLVKYFGPDLGDLEEIHRNMSAMFVVHNPVLFSNRPFTKHTIPVGHGMHISASPKQLPMDLKHFMDDATNGVVYFSLGSNIKGRVIRKEMKEAFVAAFSELPYKILWKFDEKVANLPSNVKISKWFPQQDVLRHPNVKVFVTQAGLQSLQEALTSFVPMVCIPFFGDQLQNAHRMAVKGVAVRLSKNDVTKESLKLAILEVITNPKYKETAQELGEILHDEPSTGTEKALWWTEYVLRHKGAKHLRNPALALPFFQYYLLDVLGFIGIIVLGLIFVLYLVMLIIFRLLTKLFGKKQKIE